MNSNTTTDLLALRDEAGTWYVLTPETLAKSCATPEQQAAIEEQVGMDTTGFGIIISELGNYRTLQMMGVPTLSTVPNAAAAKPQSIVVEE